MRDRRQPIVIWALCACGVLCAAFLIWAIAGQRWSVRGPYRIGWEDDPPEMYADSAGQPTGLAIELIREAARRRGMALQWIRRDESSEAALRSGAVDLWPLMTITPERLKVIHLSAPYIESIVSYMVLRGSPFRRVEDLSERTVGYRALPINLRLLSGYLPKAKLAPSATSSDLIESLCRRKIDAAFIEQDEVINQLMKGRGCVDDGFVMLTSPDARISLGVGSTMRAGAAADALRDEIDDLFAEGWLARLFAKWGYLSGRNVASVDALMTSRRRERRTLMAAAVFALLFLLALWQTFRYQRGSQRARRAENALRQSIAESRGMEERLRLLAHALWSANDCISITDTENRILYINEAFLRTYGYAENELIGQPAAMLRSSRLHRDAPIDVSAAMAGESWRGELWNQSKSGREFPITLAISRVRDGGGNFIAMVGVASDVTTRHKAEAEHRDLAAQLFQSQKLESVGRLAGGVAHDFNNLLTVINGYSNLLARKLPAGGSLHEMAAEIETAGHRAAELTAQLLLLSRKQVAQTAEMNLNDIVAEVGKMLTRVIGENIHLEFKLSPELGCVVADPGQMHQVLMNLMVNARDAMPEGGTLLIETRNVDLEEAYSEQHAELKPGAYAELKVTDTGAGMTPETMSHLFEPFFTTKKVGEGTGLGLATVYGIVKQAGGTIWAYSNPGKGTSFKIYLPRTGSPHAAPLPPKHDPASLRGTETILLVEDQGQLLRLAAGILRSYGYRVLESASPIDALRLCENHDGNIHLLLTDVVMPHMTGPELAARLKPLRPAMAVIFMSGYSERAIADRLELAASYLPKPFSPAELAEKVRGALGWPRSKGVILVVDDDPAIRILLRNLLTDASYRVLEAGDGKEAVRQVETSAIDLVITDLAMPEQEGFETMEIVRRLRPQIKIIAMSGRFAGPMLRAAEHLGAQASLAKPIQTDELLQTVARMMAG